ncbi:50S ribosomal protein L10 [Candidatus Mesenet endosymbiont of Agriotes lineatus]|uniref:50S ribosomal protein L10 n=1 Tax=Candidatus Mesenet endosymbiont of Agriotes lineatus TaxID=3077948 RepID=UPI0030D56F19
MKRSCKQKHLNNLTNIISQNSFVILVNFNYLAADDSINLRNEIKSTGGGFLVVKNSLARIAIVQIGKFNFLLNKFIGPVAIIYSSDMIATVKVLVNFINNDREGVSIVCAANLDRLLTKDDVVALAKLPSLDEMRIKIIRLILMVPNRLAYLLNLPASRVFRVLNSK